MIRVAAIEMCSTTDIAENLATARHYIAQAAQAGAQLVVLPEMFAIMGMDNPKVELNTIKEPLDHGVIQDFLAQQAQTHRLYLVGGTIPIASESDNKIKAACFSL